MIALFLIITNSFCRFQSGKWEAKIEEFPSSPYKWFKSVLLIRCARCTVLSVYTLHSVSVKWVKIDHANANGASKRVSQLCKGRDGSGRGNLGQRKWGYEASSAPRGELHKLLVAKLLRSINTLVLRDTSTAVQYVYAPHRRQRTENKIKFKSLKPHFLVAHIFILFTYWFM